MIEQENFVVINYRRREINFDFSDEDYGSSRPRHSQSSFYSLRMTLYGHRIIRKLKNTCLAKQGIKLRNHWRKTFEVPLPLQGQGNAFFVIIRRSLPSRKARISEVGRSEIPKILLRCPFS
jgi:hypothetical protein